MAARKVRLTQRSVEAARPSERRYVLHDADLAGFRLHVTPSGSKAFYAYYRVGGGRGATQREVKIGDWPTMKADQARRIATEWILEARNGADFAAQRNALRQAPRMSDLFERYLDEHAHQHKKASSIANDQRMIEKRLIPELGRKKVAEVVRGDIADLHRSMRETPYEANRTLALLSKAFRLAEIWGMRPEGSNPCRLVTRYREKPRKRFLSSAELARLGEVFRIAERDGSVTLPASAGGRDVDTVVTVSPHALAAIRLEIFTGARKGEILSLHWDWIDWEGRRVNLPDSKTGEKSIPLNAAALEILSRVPRVSGNPHVIVGAKPGCALVNPYKSWYAMRELAGLPDVRLHDLRHSFASIGTAGGLSLTIIGGLLGHSQPQTTARYAHLSDDPLRAASDVNGSRIEAAMRGAQSGIANLAKLNQ